MERGRVTIIALLLKLINFDTIAIIKLMFSQIAFYLVSTKTYTYTTRLTLNFYLYPRHKSMSK